MSPLSFVLSYSLETQANLAKKRLEYFAVREKLFLAMEESGSYHSIIIMERGDPFGKNQYRYLLSDAAAET